MAIIEGWSLCYPAAMRLQAVLNLLLLTALAAVGAAWLLVRVAG